MAKVVAVFCFMVFVSSFVEGRDWKFQIEKRLKRGFSSNSDSDGTYGGSEENSNMSKGSLNVCSGESDGSDSRELLEYNRDDHFNDNRHEQRSFSKASASASATAYNQHHNYTH